MRLPIQIRYCGALAGILALAGMACLPVGAQVPIQPSQVRNQVNQAQASSPSAAAPASSPANQSAAPAKPAAHHAAAGSKPAHKGTATPSAAASGPHVKPVSVSTPGRRDPFVALLSQNQGGAKNPDNLPPGKAGLMVDSLRIDGIVAGPNGMIAIVSNPQERVYFLRDGDKLYDGSVEHIALDGVSFHQIGTDAFGKPVDRELTKRLYSSSSGETQ